MRCSIFIYFQSNNVCFLNTIPQHNNYRMSALIKEVVEKPLEEYNDDEGPVSLVNTSHEFAYTQSKLSNELLEKWNVLPDFAAIRYRMEKRPSHTNEDVLKSLFRDAGVLASLKVGGSDELVDSLKFEKLSTTVMKMTFFDRLAVDSEIITEEGGMVRGMMDLELDVFSGSRQAEGDAAE